MRRPTLCEQTPTASWESHHGRGPASAGACHCAAERLCSGRRALRGGDDPRRSERAQDARVEGRTASTLATWLLVAACSCRVRPGAERPRRTVTPVTYPHLP